MGKHKTSHDKGTALHADALDVEAVVLFGFFGLQQNVHQLLIVHWGPEKRIKLACLTARQTQQRKTKELAFQEKKTHKETKRSTRKHHTHHTLHTITHSKLLPKGRIAMGAHPS